MSPFLVALCYGSAALLSLAVLWRFGAFRWYFHLAAIAVALWIGFIPLTGVWSQPHMTLLVGWFFTVLFLWGIGGPLFAVMHQRPHHFHWRH